MGAASDEIRVCPNHQEEEKVPLIYTFAFPGAEYWCPGCGHTHGMMGAGDIIKRTKEIDDREDYWREIGKEYLEAISAKNCYSMEWEGKDITYNELPQSEKDRLQAIEDNWKYNF